MDPVSPRHAEAADLVAHLSTIPPQHASAQSVGEYERVFALLADDAGSYLWYQAAHGLASHLLETPEGDEPTNRARAREIYAALKAQGEHDNNLDMVLTGATGLANSFVLDPAAEPEAISMATELLDETVRVARDHASPDRLASILAIASRAHGSMRTGDVGYELEIAILLQSEAVEILRGLDATETRAQLAAAWHNLGALHAERQGPIRSQDIDRAIHAFEQALVLRPADVDPVGRARTLRALSLIYPEWSAPDSIEHAQQLATDALEEAELLAADPREAIRDTPQVRRRRRRSALSAPIDWLYELPPDARIEAITDAIEEHREIVNAIDPEAEPRPWAEWLGGLGRLTGRLCHLGASQDAVDDAYMCFDAALRAIDGSDQGLLRRDLLAAWGELSHEIADFPTALWAYREAAEASRSILSTIADPEHRQADVARTRGFALFAAYAAARLGDPGEGMRLAESECTRALAPLFHAKMSLGRADTGRSSAIRRALERIRELEKSLTAVVETSLDGELAAVRGRLADHLGIHPELVSIRRTDAAAHDPDPHAAERNRLRAELATTRKMLHDLIDPGPPPAHDDSARAGLDAILRIPRDDSALVYLLATVHGGAALAALPGGRADVLLLDEVTSTLAGALLENADSGFIGALDAGRDAVNASLQRIDEVLRPTLVDPLAAFLRERGIRAVTLVALGKLGRLPLHAFAASDIALARAPSAAALADATPPGAPGGPILLVADPARTDVDSLPFARVEAHAVAAVAPADVRCTVLHSMEASFERLTADTPGCAMLHLACHGEFRHASPMESRLLLAGSDEVSLANIFFGDVDLGHMRLVTLSACETGVVESYRAPDEGTGFPTALLLAGVPAIVSTSWPVGDDTAMFFMWRFYELLLQEGQDIRDAFLHAREWLRHATADELDTRLNFMIERLPANAEAGRSELRMLADEFARLPHGSRPYASAYDWASFLLTGG